MRLGQVGDSASATLIQRSSEALELRLSATRDAVRFTLPKHGTLIKSVRPVLRCSTGSVMSPLSASVARRRLSSKRQKKPPPAA